MKTVAIVVKGKVQGVYFRQSTKEVARAADITGTVANLGDGSVKIIATGVEEQLNHLISWCYRGPSAARVSQVEVEELPFTPFDEFTIVRKGL